LSRSESLSVVVERDVEDPDDLKAWSVVMACIGTEVPEHLGAGYLHAPDCACVVESFKLCDVGWLEEFVSCAGAFSLLEGVDPLPLGRLKLMGRLVTERFDGMEGTDYDEWFEVYSAEPLEQNR
jgi:hypothetical protein